MIEEAFGDLIYLPMTFEGGVERWDGTTWKNDEQVGFSAKVVRVTTRDVWLATWSLGGIMRKSLLP